MITRKRRQCKVEEMKGKKSPSVSLFRLRVAPQTHSNRIPAHGATWRVGGARSHPVTVLADQVVQRHAAVKLFP